MVIYKKVNIWLLLFTFFKTNAEYSCCLLSTCETFPSFHSKITPSIARSQLCLGGFSSWDLFLRNWIINIGAMSDYFHLETYSTNWTVFLRWKKQKLLAGVWRAKKDIWFGKAAKWKIRLIVPWRIQPGCLFIYLISCITPCFSKNCCLL